MLLHAPTHARHAGYATTLGVLGEQVWWTKLFLGLRCDLENLPRIRPARVPIHMEEESPQTFEGFEEELRTTRGLDYIELLLRRGMCEAGVRTLYAARSESRPVYAQWLVRAADQDLIHAHAPGRYDRLASDEALLEGAYTFLAFRRMGAMGDGMAQLLRIAAAEGARSAITYVGQENLASLRGCANVGFDLDHMRVSVRRLGHRRSFAQPPDEHAHEAWAAATKR